MVTVNDQIGQVLRFDRLPKRIVSLVPSQTELLCDLGLGTQVVGVTKFCVHPGHIKSQSTIVGGTKQIHLDKIRNLKPDIILGNKEENTKAIVEACQAICPVHVSDIFTVDDSVELIKQYGILFDRQGKADELVSTIRKEMNEFTDFVQNRSVRKVAYFIWKNPWMVVGNNTFINHLLQLNKFENAYGHIARYPEIELTDLSLNTKIDLVLLSSEPFPFSQNHKNEVQKFYPNATVLLVDGEMFSWYGPRLTKAFGYFKKLHRNF